MTHCSIFDRERIWNTGCFLIIKETKKNKNANVNNSNRKLKFRNHKAIYFLSQPGRGLNFYIKYLRTSISEQIQLRQNWGSCRQFYQFSLFYPSIWKYHVDFVSRRCSIFLKPYHMELMDLLDLDIRLSKLTGHYFRAMLNNYRHLNCHSFLITHYLQKKLFENNLLIKYTYKKLTFWISKHFKFFAIFISTSVMYCFKSNVFLSLRKGQFV